MKRTLNRREVLNVLTLFLLVHFFSPGAYAQPAKDPQQDLSVTFSSTREGKEAGSVFGVVRNNSANAYPCVRLEFDLYTRFDTRPPGDIGRHLGVLPVELQNLQPRTARKYVQQLPYPAGIGLKSVSECSEQRDGQSVVIYEDPNFEGRSRSFGIGSHRLFTEQDFNDVTSSIKVPEGLAVIVYEHADEGGGYGTWVDFLEDQPDLSKYNFNNKISFLVVFDSQRSGL